MASFEVDNNNNIGPSLASYLVPVEGELIDVGFCLKNDIVDSIYLIIVND